ncbi:MAG: hypothetical protein IKC63_00535 [Clostridia bacterium]|nr:hypothetical protein [Clostridia bacterium]
MKAKLFFSLITCFLLVMLFAACTGGEVMTDSPISSTVETTVEVSTRSVCQLNPAFFPRTVMLTYLFSADPYHSDDEACIREFLTMLYACEFELIESPEIPDRTTLYRLPYIALYAFDEPLDELPNGIDSSYVYEMRIDPDAGILYQIDPLGPILSPVNTYRLTGFDKTLLEKLLATKKYGLW